MKTKIVYCLVSGPQDYYYEQLLISVCSLRKHNSDALVEVVCDYDTFATLKNTRSGIFDYNVHVIPVETPSEWDNWERSRYTKTHLRMLTSGDYLFIDTDTVICAPLDGIDDLPFGVAAVRDSHLERPLPKVTQCQHDTERWIWGQAMKAQVDIEGRWHFNSGVLYVKDTPQAYELYERWSEKYTELLARGARVDQLPLLLSNHELGGIISPMDSSMNCQVVCEEGRCLLPNAKVIHYFPGQQKTLLASPWILGPIKDTGRINATIQSVIDEPHKFFSQVSKVVIGDAAALIDTPYIYEAYVSCPKAFHIFVYLLNRCLSMSKKWKNWTNR